MALVNFRGRCASGDVTGGSRRVAGRIKRNEAVGHGWKGDFNRRIDLQFSGQTWRAGCLRFAPWMMAQ